MTKSLYIADNLETLKGMAELSKAIKTHKIEMLAKSTNSVLRQAEYYDDMGDEEQAYVFFMKYFNLIDIIKNQSDFKQKIKVKQHEYFGRREDIFRRLDRLEKLKTSLEKRYEKKLEEKQQKEIADANKENVDIKNVDAPNSTFILCPQLHKRISDGNEAILLLDCRPTSDFQQSRIKFDHTINIPGEIIQNGMTPSLLTKHIADPSQHRLFDKRGKMDLIVLLDEDTSGNVPLHPDKPISILRKIFHSWDPDTNYKSILILDGGFHNFWITYPMLTTNPKYQVKPKDVPMSNAIIKEIEYPSLTDIKMKADPKNKPPSIPMFDRASKPKFMDSHQPVNPLVVARQRELILDKVLQKEKEVLSIGTELSNVVNAPASNETERNDWFVKQDELEYKLVQKEDELNETIQGLNEATTFENKFDTLQIDNNNPEYLEVKARITAKENAHLENEKRLRILSEIEEKRKAAREQQKRHLQLKEEEEEIIRPKQPAIDRSVKPNIDNLAKFPHIHRDFSPVHGSYGDVGATGLKNLGNTCYMNSIIQCLLNLEGLREYLIRDQYLRHINRKSKTHGLVTEELAQLCKQLWCGKYKSVAPRDFRNIVGREHKMFATYDQQDAHELLVILIDMLHSELQFPMHNTIVDKTNKSEVAWCEFLKNMESIIHSNFFGQIRSTVKCRTCEFESATYEGFSHLSLELPQDNRPCDLTDCLDLYFNGELIDGWTCPQCKQNRSAVKKLDISKLPPVLIIHLKRFYASLDSPNTYVKKQNGVYFPIQDFNISDYIIRSLKQRNTFKSYNLYAVSNHYGTMNRGHYTAFCKNDRSQQWYKYDDNYVTQIASNDVSSSAGYILFYSSL